MNEEGKVIQMNAAVEADRESLVKATVEINEKAGEKKPLTPNQMKNLQKQAAQEFADYKRRLRESVELKKLQVEEIELNIQYYHASKEYDSILKKVAEEEAKKKAEAEAVRLEAEKRVIEAKQGKPRTAEEIEEGKKTVVQ